MSIPLLSRQEHSLWLKVGRPEDRENEKQKKKGSVSSGVYTPEFKPWCATYWVTSRTPLPHRQGYSKIATSESRGLKQQ